MGVFLGVATTGGWRALVLEAQMRSVPQFLLRLYAESGRLLQQQDRQGRPIRQWQVVVICPLRTLAFGDPEPVAEFLERRVRWLELLLSLASSNARPLLRSLPVLLQTEDLLPAPKFQHPDYFCGRGIAPPISGASHSIPSAMVAGH